MKYLIAAILIAVSVQPVSAVNVLINDTKYDVKALIKSERLEVPRTGIRWHYTLNDRPEELILSQPIENPEIPDERPYEQKHPRKAFLKKVVRVITLGLAVWLMKRGVGI